MNFEIAEIVVAIIASFGFCLSGIEISKRKSLLYAILGYLAYFPYLLYIELYLGASIMAVSIIKSIMAIALDNKNNSFQDKIYWLLVIVATAATTTSVTHNIEYLYLLIVVTVGISRRLDICDILSALKYRAS